MIGGIECLLLMILVIIGLITKTQKIIKHINLQRVSENSLYSFNTVRNALDISKYIFRVMTLTHLDSAELPLSSYSMKIFIVRVFPQIATGTRTQLTGAYYVTRISVLIRSCNSRQSYPYWAARQKNNQ